MVDFTQDISYDDCVHNADVLRAVVEEAYKEGLAVTHTGAVADYIPELSKANKDDFGLCVVRNDGISACFGQIDTRFTIQSVGKVVMLAAALKHFGTDEVFSHVLMEPSGDSFSSIIKLDTVSNLPYNPMINAGAIQIAGLLVRKLGFDDMLELTQSLCSDNDISLNKEVLASEEETGDRNRAIVYLLESKGVLQSTPDQALDLYFKMCSLNVTAHSLASMGLVLANDGQNPLTGDHLLSPKHTQIINSLMFMCGMYDRSGEFAVRVGIPAKSGVGGGITCGVKGRMGIGIYGPSLDEKGNSVAGLRALEYLSHTLHLHAFDYHPYIDD